MSKNILILWLGAFGFAVARHLSENNSEQIFYTGEKNPEIFQSIQKTRKHPYFFRDVMLPGNIKLVGDADLRPLLEKTDIIISAIPCQFLAAAFSELKDHLKDGVIILNLAKGINNQTLKTSSETLEEVLWDENYSYAYLAGGMIAEELVAWNKLGADIVTEDSEAWTILKKLVSIPIFLEM